MNFETVVLETIVCDRHQTFSAEEKYFDHSRQTGGNAEGGAKCIEAFSIMDLFIAVTDR